MTEINTEKKAADKSDRPLTTYRTGVAARMAGLSVETLRVWERRYALSETSRSVRGQRLYSEAQVRRLALLKQLVDQGHQIGALVDFSDEQLKEMATAVIVGRRQKDGRIRVALIGDRLARRIDMGGRDGLPLDIKCRCRGLEDVASLSFEGSPEVLLIELSELHSGAVPLIAELRRALKAAAVVILYRFCASATIRQLREQGCLVARVPPDLGEIVSLCRAALADHRVKLPAQHVAQEEPRRFDDAALTEIASARNTVNCECPRHLADILMMIGSFERYSGQCASRNPDDAQVHRELGLAASQARAILELALERLARAEGLLVPAQRASPGTALVGDAK